MPASNRLIDSVRWCEADGIYIFLDITAGTFSALSPAASEAFRHYLAGEAPGPALKRILAEKAWLDDGHATKPNHGRVECRPPAVRCPLSLTCILGARSRLRRDGLSETLAWARSFDSAAGKTTLPNAQRIFARTASLLPSKRGDEDCLPASLALFAFLRSQGFSPEFVIGVKRFPFGAHAWVEHDGEPLLQEHPGHLSRFSEILRVA